MDIPKIDERALQPERRHERTLEIVERLYSDPTKNHTCDACRSDAVTLRDFGNNSLLLCAEDDEAQIDAGFPSGQLLVVDFTLNASWANFIGEAPLLYFPEVGQIALWASVIKS